MKIVTFSGLPSKEFAAELLFGFPIETLGTKQKINPTVNETQCAFMALYGLKPIAIVCLQDSILAFWKHGLKGKSFHSDAVILL